MKRIGFALALALLSAPLSEQTAWSETTPAAPVAPSENARVRYREGKEVNFEQLLIQGQLKRPELKVVTGDEAGGTNGLVRLRQNFIDQMQMDFGEEVQ